MWKILALSAGLALVSASAATAQPQCDQRDSVLQVLQQKYKEQPVALGVTHNGGLVAIDNVLWGGAVTNSYADDADTRAIRTLNAKIALDQRVSCSLLPLGDGLTLALKR